jgi:hypothetical protein
MATIDIFTIFVCVKTTHKMKLLIEHSSEIELKRNKSTAITINPNKEVAFALLKLQFNTKNKKDLDGITFDLRIEYNFYGESRFKFDDNNTYEFNEDLSFTKPIHQPDLISAISVRFNIPANANTDAVITTTFQLFKGFPEPINFDDEKDLELLKFIKTTNVLDYGNLLRQYDGEALLRYAKTYQNYTETNNLEVLRKNLFDYYILRQATTLVGMGRLNSDTLVNELEPFLYGYSFVREANEEHFSNPRPDWQMLKQNLLIEIQGNYDRYSRFDRYIEKRKTDSEKWENDLLLFDQFRNISKTYVERLVAVFRELADKETIFKLIQVNISDWHFDNSLKNTEVLTINLKLIPGYEEVSKMCDSTIKFSISNNLINYCIEFFEEVIKHTSEPEKFNITDRAKQIVYSNRIASLPDWKNAGYEYRDGLVCRPELERNKLEGKAFYLVKQAISYIYSPYSASDGFNQINKESEQTKK